MEILQPDYSGLKTNMLKEAYSNCVSRIAPLENDVTKIYNVTSDIIKLTIKYNLEDKFTDVYSLSATIYELSNIKTIHRRRDFLNFFYANAKKVKEYKNLLPQTNTTIKNI